MRYVRTTAPTVPVVTVSEARARGVGSSSDDDETIEAILDAATEHFDGRAGILGRALVNQSWRLDRYGPDGCGRIKIDMPNVSSIVSVTYLLDGEEMTWSEAEYRLGSLGNFFFVGPKSGYSWPSTDDQEDAVRVTFVTGYGDAGEDVPTPIRQAIILLAKHLYGLTERNLFLAREDIPGVRNRQYVVSDAAGGVIGAAIDALVAPYQVRMV